MSVQETIAAAAERAQKEQQEAQAKLARDVMIDIQTKVFDRAAGYINLIMFGGYAGAFAIWNFTREHLTVWAEVWIALLLTVSLVTFILFEVFKMVITSLTAFKQRALIVKKLPPDQFLAELADLERYENVKALKWLFPVWIGALVISVASGLGAVGISLWSFLDILLFGVSDSVASLYLIST